MKLVLIKSRLVTNNTRGKRVTIVIVYTLIFWKIPDLAVE